MPYVTSWERIAKKEGKREGKREGLKKGLKEGEKTGEKKGIRSKALDTAKKMLQDNCPIDTIAKYTGLAEKKIISLKA